MSREPTAMLGLLSYKMGSSLARPGMYLLGAPAQNDPLAWEHRKTKESE
jgi:hypothetical protein